MSEAIAEVADSRREVKLTEKDVARFWAKVDKNGPVPAHVPEIGNCWVWTAAKIKRGYSKNKSGHLVYGIFGFDGKVWKAHRFSFAVAIGSIDLKKMVCHKCDNPICVRPTHLKEGTAQDNMDDAISKGRFGVGERHWWRSHMDQAPHGEKSPNAVLTEEHVLSIRALWEEGKLKQSEIGKRFNVSQGLVSMIVLRKRWAHI